MDFSEFETTRSGTWRLGGVIDYAAKYSLGCPVFGTQTALDAIEVIETAIVEAERLLEMPLKDDLVDPQTGEIVPLVVVTDNGPAFKATRFGLYIASRPELAHVRTKHASRRPTA